VEIGIALDAESDEPNPGLLQTSKKKGTTRMMSVVYTCMYTVDDLLHRIC